MPLWRLTPIDPLDSDWQASSHCGPVIVRAPNEEVARETAEKAFGVKVGFKPGEGVKAPPWLRPALTRADMIEDARYDPEGQPEVLSPLPP